MVIQNKLLLFRNKKVASIKQKKKEIAKCLKENNLDVAKAKMDSIIREEDMITSYDILGPLCEILKERVTYIITNNECPPDLRAQLDSIIYASTRLDLEEFLKLREMIMIRYGQAYVMKADSNADKLVNINLVEKLRVKPASDVFVTIRLKQLCKEQKIPFEFPMEIDSEIPIDPMSAQNPYGNPGDMNPFGNQQNMNMNNTNPYGPPQGNNPYGPPGGNNSNPYGPPQGNNPYGPPGGNNSNPYGPPQGNNPYGPPSNNNNNDFGPPQDNNNPNPFGTPQNNNNDNAFGPPQDNNNPNPFGPPQDNNNPNPFGQDNNNPDPFGPPQDNNNPYGPPQDNNNNNNNNNNFDNPFGGENNNTNNNIQNSFSDPFGFKKGYSFDNDNVNNSKMDNPYGKAPEGNFFQQTSGQIDNPNNVNVNISVLSQNNNNMNNNESILDSNNNLKNKPP